jgi:hypothetical protein
MSRCANTEALDAYLNKADKAELRQEQLDKEIEPYLSVISEQIEVIKSIHEANSIEFERCVIEDLI